MALRNVSAYVPEYTASHLNKTVCVREPRSAQGSESGTTRRGRCFQLSL